jgi:arsenate reductase-like glutaredoxin family protein
MEQGMWQLYQFPLCPFSRKVRLLMAEKGIPYELVRENPWDYREEFQKLNPAVRTPSCATKAAASRSSTAGRSANTSKKPATRTR